jgi:flagellar biosynthesis/type III secretory pathway protein FliH
MMSDFECLPIGTAARLAELEAEVERLRALNVELLEALKLAQQIIGHPDDAHSKLIAAAIAQTEGQR